MKSHDRKDLEHNTTALGHIATAFGLPVVLSTVGVQSRGMGGTSARCTKPCATRRRSTAPRSIPGKTRNSAPRWKRPAAGS
jgi:hypothetical protein